MLVLCDRPDPPRTLLGSDRRPEPRAAASLDAPTLGLWRGLAGADTLWALDLGSGSPAGSHWSRLAILSHAPASQFDQLRGPLARRVGDLGPVACLALDGDGFHGHHGRSWSTVEGNLHLSVALPVRLPAAALGASLSMLPAVAVCDAVSAVTGGAVRPSIKWVNDIGVGGAKLAGVLTTTRLLGHEVEQVVFGIGVNVAVAPAIEPTPFVPSATCLRRCRGGEAAGLGGLLVALLEAVPARLAQLEREGPEAIRQAYERRSMVLGRGVRVWEDRATDGVAFEDWPPPLASGIVEGIGVDLALWLRGRREPVDRGRLALDDDVRAWRRPGVR